MKKAHLGRLIFCLVVLVLLLADITMYKQIKSYYPDAWQKTPAITLPKDEPDARQNGITKALQKLKLNSKYAMVIDLQDNRTLYEKNSDQKLYPASLTKVMTAITALDNAQDLNQKVTIHVKDLQGLIKANASVAGLQVGDQLRMEDLLYALILPSGADGANALANHLNGSTKNFVADMNEKAQAMGMTHTHFTNTTGLHDKQHYTTLQDLKKMMTHAWKNPAFRKVITTLRYTIPDVKSHPKGLKLHSTLLLYGGKPSFPGGTIIGGKSGYTPEAGCCLISIAKLSDGRLYMVITAQASGSPVDDHKHMDDAKTIYKQIAHIQKDGTQAKQK